MIMKLYEVSAITPPLSEQLLSLWEASVRATHHFLSDMEIRQIKAYVPSALQAVEHLIITSFHRHFQVPRILWQLVIRGVLSAFKARKLIKKNKNNNSYY